MSVAMRARTVCGPAHICSLIYPQACVQGRRPSRAGQALSDRAQHPIPNTAICTANRFLCDPAPKAPVSIAVLPRARPELRFFFEVLAAEKLVLARGFSGV